MDKSNKKYPRTSNIIIKFEGSLQKYISSLSDLYYAKKKKNSENCENQYEILWKDVEFYKYCLKYSKDKFGKSHQATCLISEELGLLYEKLGLYKHAINYLKGSLPYYVAQEQYCAEELQIKRFIIGNILLKLGDNETALKMLARALNSTSIVNNTKKEDLIQARIMHAIGLIYFKQDDISKGIEYMKNGLNLYENIVGPNHIETVKSYLALGQNIKMGQYLEAREYFIKILKIINNEKNLPMPLSEIYEVIAEANMHLQDVDIAIKYFLKALKLKKEELNPYHPEFSNIYKNMGGLYLTKFKLKNAFNCLKESILIRNFSLNEKHPDNDLCYDLLTRHIYFLGKSDKKLNYYFKSTKFLNVMVDPNHKTLFNLKTRINELKENILPI
jgi:tetratricopeptide (TPR) repeat protein